MAQDSVTLEGRIWDFQASHPDFEGASSGVRRGAVENTLGPDGRPVLARTSNVFSSKENFQQWYRDVPGVNESRSFSVTLNEEDGQYTFDSSSFFPIDGELLGNEGDQYQDKNGTPHNFHFATYLSGEFSFQNDDDRFTFRGDDDLWVFIDDKLGIDLGGVHGPEEASITGAGLKKLGLEPGQAYDLDIFHAERHTTGSNFRITSNFDIRPPENAELPETESDGTPIAGAFGSFESVAFPGQFMRHQGFVLKLDAADPSSPSLLRRDATFQIQTANIETATAEEGSADTPLPGLAEAKEAAGNCTPGLILLANNMYRYPNDPAETDSSDMSWNDAWAQFAEQNLPACRAVGEFVEANKDAPALSPIMTRIGETERVDTFKDYFDSGVGIVNQGSRIPNYCPKLHRVQFDCESATERLTNSIAGLETNLEVIRGL